MIKYFFTTWSVWAWQALIESSNRWLSLLSAIYSIPFFNLKLTFSYHTLREPCWFWYTTMWWTWLHLSIPIQNFIDFSDVHLVFLSFRLKTENFFISFSYDSFTWIFFSSFMYCLRYDNTVLLVWTCHSPVCWLNSGFCFIPIHFLNKA